MPKEDATAVNQTTYLPRVGEAFLVFPDQSKTDEGSGILVVCTSVTESGKVDAKDQPISIVKFKAYSDPKHRSRLTNL